jgi:hypothetical protein
LLFALLLLRQKKKPAKPNRARTPTTPPTIPPIAPPERPGSGLLIGIDEAAAPAVFVAEAEDVVNELVGVEDDPAVVDVKACRSDKLIV